MSAEHRPLPGSDRRWGVWLVGARGSVATTAAVGSAAIPAGRATATGMVTGSAPFAQADLPSLGDVVLGGCDPSGTSLAKRAELLAQGGVFPLALSQALADDLQAIDRRVVPGIAADEAAQHPSAAVARIGDELERFATEHDLDDVVVVNVSSTEAPIADHPAHHDPEALLAAVARDSDVLPPSGLYALAAIRGGHAFVDFTPSSALTVPAILDLATGRVPVAGRDGKTGETLVKTALAPMFADRALHVHSWSGMNLLGGGDGQTLADPVTAASKVESKGDVLGDILGHRPEGPVRIDNVSDLGDWKTAWDLITFEGFLGTRMQMQFTWQGCDSTLAAPLVLDLARLVVAAGRAGRTGPQQWLGYFFKAPLGDGPRRLAEQFAELVDEVGGLAEDVAVGTNP
ncbi:inositol-3-phosphate synthase [Salsipaludibacter albus]|uniref:inositol-3-phosphate synthase n=1 Tax=Salsipaludibacter albus TaxID=2849650 RepID=UPI001EE4E468